jgi:hypothetical protein
MIPVVRARLGWEGGRETGRGRREREVVRERERENRTVY